VRRCTPGACEVIDHYLASWAFRAILNIDSSPESSFHALSDVGIGAGGVTTVQPAI
jgi:hypothetical protein